MSAPVFFLESSRLIEFTVGDVFTLDGAEGRHAGVVQRRGAGEIIDIVDGHGVRLTCVIEAVSGENLSLQVTQINHEPEPAFSLVLVQALAKGDRDELAIEAATELGVDAVIPWQADRSIVVWRGPRAAKSHARWQTTVRAATKQARRARLPQVEQPVSSSALVSRIAATTAAGGVALILHEQATQGLVDIDAIAGLQHRDESVAQPEVLVIVGPEGGISDAERDAFVEAGGTLTLLGPHVLRTSTAGPAAIAVLSAMARRW